MKKQLILSILSLYMVMNITLSASYYNNATVNEFQPQGSTSLKGYYDTTTQPMGSRDVAGQYYGGATMNSEEGTQSTSGYSSIRKSALEAVQKDYYGPQRRQ